MKPRMKPTKDTAPRKTSKGVLGLTVASILAGCLALDANADTITVTQTVDGVTWQLLIDPDAKTARLGTGSGKMSSEASSMAVLKGMTGSLVAPSSFEIDGEIYGVTHVSERAFPRDRAGKLYNITFPLDSGTLRFQDHVFITSSISNILFKGPSCAGPGESQGYQTLRLPDLNSGRTQSIFRNCSNVNHVVVGPNVRADDLGQLENFFDSATDAKLFVPRNGAKNISWNGSHEISLGGTDNSLVYYGPSESFGLEMYDTYATFTPNTAEGLANVISLAQTFETGFGLDARIAITNRICAPSESFSLEMADDYATFVPNTEEGLAEALTLAQTFETMFGLGTRIAITNRIDMTAVVTESMLQNVTLTAPPWYMTFAVQTQAQLGNVLAVVQENIPIVIDIDGATEDIVVPDNRQVSILAKSGWTFGRKHTGLVIHLK